MATPNHEVLALRFGTHADRLARENFFLHDGHPAPESAMPMDFYLWVIRNDDRLLVVDTGFTSAVAARRGRTIIRSPLDGLLDIGIRPADVTDVVITHMHYDHAGCLDLFPTARIHLQEAELRFCTGPSMRHKAVSKPFEPDHVNAVVQRLYDGNLVLHNGIVELAPGVTLHPVGGHTPGLQVVRVHTARGWVVLASDAAHLWANIRRRSPFPIFDNLTSMLETYDAVEALADSADHIIPGHDPQVALRFPGLTENWARLHEEPIAPYLEPAASLSGARR